MSKIQAENQRLRAEVDAGRVIEEDLRNAEKEIARLKAQVTFPC